MLRPSAGELSPSGGSVRVAGRVGYLRQDLTLDAARPVDEVLGIARARRALRAIEHGAVAERLFADVDDDWDDVLLLDEPTNNLDLASTRQAAVGRAEWGRARGPAHRRPGPARGAGRRRAARGRGGRAAAAAAAAAPRPGPGAGGDHRPAGRRGLGPGPAGGGGQRAPGAGVAAAAAAPGGARIVPGRLPAGRPGRGGGRGPLRRAGPGRAGAPGQRPRTEIG